MNKTNIGWMDSNLINMLYYENRLFDEVIDDNRDGFTEEFKIRVKNLLYDIGNSKKFDFYRKNSFKVEAD